MSDQTSARKDKTKLGPKQLCIASWSIAGINKAGKRQKVEMWMKDKQATILALQETMTRGNGTETRHDYTWFFSG